MLSTFVWILLAYFSIRSYFASCFVCVRDDVAEVVLLVLFVELEDEVLLVPEVLLLMIFPARLLLALRRFLDLKRETLELLIFILYFSILSYSHVYAFL